MPDSESDDDYGPALPPSIAKSSARKNNKKRTSSKDSRSSSDEDDCMPALPPAMLASRSTNKPSADVCATVSSHEADQLQRKHSLPERSIIIGPVMPASMTHKVTETSQEKGGDDHKGSSSDDDSYGPALPPGFIQKPVPISTPAVKGPALPPGGLPPPEEEEDDDVIGPLPPKSGIDLGGYAAADVERRADSMKQKLDEASRPQQQVREEWMLSLPPERAAEFGLGPRQFRRTTPAERGDTSGWTEVGGGSGDGAASKPKRKPEPEVDLAVERRDKMMGKVADKLKKNRKTSLLEMHQQKTKKAKKEQPESAPRKRQEFDRDRDLSTNRFDEAQRKAAIKRSRGAADMFGAGSQKYL